MLIMAIDLGTSSAKSVLYDAHNGEVLAKGSGTYSLLYPKPGFVEQSPIEWWDGVVTSIRKCIKHFNGDLSDIAAIGLSGQMVGLVPVDYKGKPLYNCITHLDTRCGEELDAMRGDDGLTAVGMNQASYITTAPKLYWLYKHERRIWDSMHVWLYPKDYIRFRLTGTMGTEVTDASDSMFMDFYKNEWHPIIEKYGMDVRKFPEITHSHQIAGCLTRQAAEETGLREGIPVVAGGADMACTALGSGAIETGVVSVTIGTTGHIKTAIAEPKPSLIGKKTLQLAHAIPGMYYAFGAIPAGGLSYAWLGNVLLTYAEKPEGGSVLARMDEAAAEVPAGSNGVFFLPYLGGSLIPHLDSNASGGFVGLRASSSAGVMARAVMEGVAYHFKQIIQLFEDSGLPVDRVCLGEGGCNSRLWVDILSSVFNRETHVVNNKDGAPLGAAIIAGVGAGIYSDWHQAARSMNRTEYVHVDSRAVEVYERAYEVFLRFYPALRGIFKDIADLED